MAWSETSAPPDAATNPQLFDHPRPVRIHAYPTTSINNRYVCLLRVRATSSPTAKDVTVVEVDVITPKAFANKK